MKLGKVKSILVLNRNHIGDCLLTTPLLRSLKRRFPRARLCVSIPASNHDLLATNPHVDEILIRPEISSWAAKFRFAGEMRQRNYDLIISLQEKSNFYAWATHYATLFRRPRPTTVGLDHPRTRSHYDHNVPVLEERHEVYKYLDIAELLGCPRERNPVLELTPPAASRERINQFTSLAGFNPDQRFIGINPGGTKPEKRWAVERFAEVADRLHEATGLPAMILGGPKDLDKADAIQSAMRSHQPFVAAGKASLGDTAALLERCRLLVTGDTGPMHMAVALAVPVVSLFGPTNPVKFGPFTSLATVLRHPEGCPDCLTPCIHTISVDETVEAAVQLYSAPPSRVTAGRGSSAAGSSCESPS